MNRIEDIAWNQLHHAYGTCEEFPHVIEALGSTAPEARRWARNWLEELLFHQGTHYPANEFAVPFLFQAAANPLLPERGKLFSFLTRFLAERIAPPSPQQCRAWKERFQRKYGMNFGGEHWRNVKRQSLAAAWHNRDFLVNMATGDPEVAGRCWAVFLLADLGLTGRHYGGSYGEQRPCDWFSPDELGEVLSLFQERAVADPSQAVRVCAIFGIGFLRDDPQAALLLRALDVPANDSVMRLAAGAARHVTEMSVPHEVTARVVEGIVKNLLTGMGTACIYDGSESVLIAAYGKLGLELEPGRGPSAAAPFAFVPFPKLTAWLNAAVDENLPLTELVERSLDHASNTEECRAVALLGRLKPPNAQVDRYLRKLLGHRDPVIRMTAAVALGRKKGTHRIPIKALISAFRAPLRSRHASLRLRAVRNLCRLWRPKPKGPIPLAMPMVLKAAQKETDLRIRHAICQFLDRAAIEDRIDPTYRNLEPPLSANAKQAVLILVSWLDSPDIGPAALRSLRGFYSPYRGQKGPSAPLAALEPLLTLLGSDAPHRHAAPAILARIRSDRVLPAFLESLRRESDPEVRTALRWALDRLPKSSHAAEAILAAHHDESLLIDGHVAQFLALAQRKSKKVAETLVAVLSKSPRDEATVANRCSLVEAIGCLSAAPGLTSAALIETALTDPDTKVRWAAAKAFACAPVPVELVVAGCRRIAESRDESAVGGMLELLDHGNTPTMPDLAPSLLYLLNHPDHFCREKTIKALAKFHADNAEVERAVLGRLGDESGGVVYSAAQYPYRVLPGSEVVPPLVKLAPKLGMGIWHNLVERASLKDLLPVVDSWLATFDDWQLRSLCDWVAEQGPRAAILTPTLLKRLEDPQPANRFSIIQALIAVDRSEVRSALQAIEPLLGHEL